MNKKIVKYALFCLVLLCIFTLFSYFYPIKKIAKDCKIDYLVVLKSKRELKAYCDGELLVTYPISLGFAPVGQKYQEGDGKTPEGIYRINGKNENSTCYKNLGISYPNEEQIQQAKEDGVSPGGDIKIHGLLNGHGDLGKLHLSRDWTFGCIAVTNEEMEELYQNVEINTPIKIIP